MLDADGASTLTFSQAQEKARDWFRNIERHGGRVVDQITVRVAIEAYIHEYRVRGGKALADLRATVNAHILPEFGDKAVASLTHQGIRAWHHRLATSPARLRTSPRAENQRLRTNGDVSIDGQRARRSTANRVLTVLKAALNHAFREGRAPSDDAWRRVRPFPNVEAPRVRYLTDAECVRLVNACPTSLRKLVTAALLTGCRYGELVALQAGDFDPDAGVLHIRLSKSGKARTVHLPTDAAQFFQAETAGKANQSLLLPNSSGGAWGKSHQFRPLRDACLAAKIEPAISFHALRHTFASRLAMKNVPMHVVAAALGNSATICAKHYAHLSPGYVSDTIRQHAGGIGIVPDQTTVRPLKPTAQVG